MNRAVPKSAAALPYYGWFVLAASALVEMLTIGATSYGAGLFVLPLQSEFHLSRADASSALLLVNLGAIFMAPYAGQILDRYPIRNSICAGVLCFSAALAAIALTTSLTVMVVLLILPVAMGFTILGPMTTATLAARWFYRRRGLALGIAAIATSAGGLTIVPLLSKTIEAYGWRHALLGEATAMFVIVTLLGFFVLKDNPFRAGLGANPENAGRTDGAGMEKTSRRRNAPAKLWTGRNILFSRGFWAPSLMLAGISGLSQAIVTTVPPYGHQLGFAAAASAFLISGFSIGAALTKITVGVLADFCNRRVLLFTTTLCMPLALSLLCFFQGYTPVIAACCLAGVALGGTLPTSAFLIARRFDVARFGSTIGWTYVLIFGASIAAVRFMGAMFDLNGGYRIAFAALLSFSLFIWILSLLIDLPVASEKS